MHGTQQHQNRLHQYGHAQTHHIKPHTTPTNTIVIISGTHKLRSITNYIQKQHINMRRNHRHNNSNARNPTAPNSAPSARPHPNTPYEVAHHTNKHHCHHARDPSASFNHELHPEKNILTCAATTDTISAMHGTQQHQSRLHRHGHTQTHHIK
jgi:hypothetical protein